MGDRDERFQGDAEIVKLILALMVVLLVIYLIGQLLLPPIP